MSEDKENTSGKESRRVHGSIPEVSGPVSIAPMERFLQHWAQIDRMQSEKEAQKREERESQEVQRRAEAQERQVERETQQQQRFLQILAEISRPSPAVLPTSSMPKLSVSKFIEGTDDMGAYLEAFEATAPAGKWPRNQWATILRSSLSGTGLTAVAAMPAD